MDQNPTPPSSSDTPQPQAPQVPTTPSTPDVPPATPTSVPPVITPTPPVDGPMPQPITPPSTPVIEPSTPIPAAQVTTPSSTEHQTPPSSLPPASHKKTIAVAAAGISVILVVVGVYAMTKESFNTQTKQEAAMPYTVPTQAAPTVEPTPSDVVDQDLNGVEDALKNADTATSVTDQELSATPADLQ